MDELRVGDIVVFKDQSKNLRNDCILGGAVMAIVDAAVVLHRHNRGLRTCRLDEVRKLEAADIPEDGIEVV